MDKHGPLENTDKEIFREPNEKGETDYYCNSISVTANHGIAMKVGGVCVTMPLREWHELAMKYGQLSGG